MVEMTLAWIYFLGNLLKVPIMIQETTAIQTMIKGTIPKKSNLKQKGFQSEIDLPKKQSTERTWVPTSATGAWVSNRNLTSSGQSRLKVDVSIMSYEWFKKILKKIEVTLCLSSAPFSVDLMRKIVKPTQIIKKDISLKIFKVGCGQALHTF